MAPGTDEPARNAHAEEPGPGARPPAAAGRSIVALGELLVEVMREAAGVSLGRRGAVFRGPFASGAPAIFAGAAARLGGRVRFAGVRGDDPFGTACVEHLLALGVDVGWVRTDHERPTGVAFVAYQHDGSRTFLFHVGATAAATLHPGDLSGGLLDDAVWLHVTGSSLGVSGSVREAVDEAVALAHAAGAVIAFDPNLRTELMPAHTIRAICQRVLPHAQVVFPSGDEAALLTGVADPLDACRALLQQGPEVVVWKRGAAGCSVVTADGVVEVPALAVETVDPTGAGDCFAAGFAVARLEGSSAVEAARFAGVAAALSTTALGPMEALPTRQEVLLQLRE